MASVHCVEPQPKQHQTLQQWAETQGGRVTCHPQALGETTGSAILQSYPQMPRYASIRSATEPWMAEHSRTRPLQAVPVEIEVSLSAPFLRIDNAALTHFPQPRAAGEPRLEAAGNSPATFPGRQATD
jgi:FkbM family methyltransferase